jgi:outer membrane lipoprotein-sorting protein
MRQVLQLIIFLFLASYRLTAQDDPQAVKILDRFAETSRNAPSVSMKFRIITTDLAEDTGDTINGSVIMRGDKFCLNLNDNITWYNGETAWNYLPAEKEVTITRPDKKDESFMSRPSTIFSIYKTGYKNRLIEEKSDSWLIDLYPTDLKSDLIRIRLLIGKPAMNLISAEYKKKDGLVANLYVDEFNLKQRADPSLFSFSPEKYRDIEIIDMR